MKHIYLVEQYCLHRAAMMMMMTMIMMTMIMMTMMAMMMMMMMMMVMMVEQEGVTSIACAEQPERPREAAEGPVSVPAASDGKSLPVAFTHFDTIAIIVHMIVVRAAEF